MGGDRYMQRYWGRGRRCEPFTARWVRWVMMWEISIEDHHSIQGDTAALSTPAVLLAGILDCLVDGGVSLLGSAAISTEEIGLVPFESSVVCAASRLH